MDGGNVNQVFNYEYSVHFAALRNAPQSAAEVIKIIFRHGAYLMRFAVIGFTWWPYVTGEYAGLTTRNRRWTMKCSVS